MASAGAPDRDSKHGGSRSILCWQDKLALCDENVILEFIATSKCMKKCKCFDKVRALGEDKAMQVIRGLREARMGGTCALLTLLRKIVVILGDMNTLPNNVGILYPGGATLPKILVVPPVTPVAMCRHVSPSYFRAYPSLKMHFVHTLKVALNKKAVGCLASFLSSPYTAGLTENLCSSTSCLKSATCAVYAGFYLQVVR